MKTVIILVLYSVFIQDGCTDETYVDENGNKYVIVTNSDGTESQYVYSLVSSSGGSATEENAMSSADRSSVVADGTSSVSTASSYSESTSSSTNSSADGVTSSLGSETTGTSALTNTDSTSGSGTTGSMSSSNTVITSVTDTGTGTSTNTDSSSGLRTSGTTTDTGSTSKTTSTGSATETITGDGSETELIDGSGGSSGSSTGSETSSGTGSGSVSDTTGSTDVVSSCAPNGAFCSGRHSCCSCACRIPGFRGGRQFAYCVENLRNPTLATGCPRNSVGAVQVVPSGGKYRKVVQGIVRPAMDVSTGSLAGGYLGSGGMRNPGSVGSTYTTTGRLRPASGNFYSGSGYAGGYNTGGAGLVTGSGIYPPYMMYG